LLKTLDSGFRRNDAQGLLQEAPLIDNHLMLLWQEAQNPQGNLCEAFSSPSATSAVEYSPYRQSLFTRQGLMEDEKRRGRISQAV